MYGCGWRRRRTRCPSARARGGRARRLRAVPGARPALLGIRNLRGQILPVVDLAPLLGDPADQRRGTRLLVAEAGGRRAGFAIDEVTGVGEPGRAGRGDRVGSADGGHAQRRRPVGVVDVPRIFDALAGISGIIAAPGGRDGGRTR